MGFPGDELCIVLPVKGPGYCVSGSNFEKYGENRRVSSHNKTLDTVWNQALDM